MKKSPLFSSSNLMTAIFMTLYAIGAWVNYKSGNLVMAGIWGVLFASNAAMLTYRLLKKHKS